MKRKRLLWQLFPTYILLIVCALLAVILYDASSLRRFFLQHTTQDLLNQAHLIQPLIQERLLRHDYQGIDSISKNLGRTAGLRITVIRPSGQVIGDSQEDIGSMDNHANREEIGQALLGHVGHSIRYSHTLRTEMIYVAIPLTDSGVNGVLRVSLPILSINNPLYRIDLQAVFAALIIAVLAGLVSLVVSRRISRPLEELRVGARRIAQGNFSQPLAVPESEEIGSLAEAMNDMARQLEERIDLMMSQQNEQAAILSSMLEGVVAVDMEERLISINRAAARMLHIDTSVPIHGRLLQESVRNADLQRFIARALREYQSVEGDLILRSGGERYLQAHGAQLKDAAGKVIGAVVVLNDITRLRKLESMRRDFVANVSHELRTPLTSIKGFVEALIDGALDDREDAEHFLSVVSSQVDRINAIIEDLLLLSTLEQGNERLAAGIEDGSINDLLQNAAQLCAMKATTRGIMLQIDCDEKLRMRMNIPLLEQAVVNLIDNAIKYSDEGQAISISATQSDGTICIEVSDSGCGIAAEHLPHLFERFYRVDKARSRKLGGTGLGLAIVKHIVTAHGGSVSVTSTPGLGSQFTLRFPVQ